jgi:hypothetical protein
MKYTLSFLFVFVIFLSCPERKKPLPDKVDERTFIINYLKKEYKVNPDIKRFGIYYKEDLLKRINSLDTDLVINSNLSIKYYQPLNLNFIRYRNVYEYTDKKHEEDFAIYLIQNKENKKIYLDWIDDVPNIIEENFCSKSEVDNKITIDSKYSLVPENIGIYNSINTSRLFGINETRLHIRKSGLEGFLDDNFRFLQPDEMVINNLFNFYDGEINYKHDSLLINLPQDLFSYITQAYKGIKQIQYEGVDHKKDFQYLKEQINLIRTQYWDHPKYFWVFKYGNSLRTRSPLIHGNTHSGFTYFIDEYSVCF